ncbi:peptidase S9 family protein [Parvularcula lutaonensis]|nr:peptidase S9 family protein [Parvularcula lutaonensis]
MVKATAAALVALTAFGAGAVAQDVERIERGNLILENVPETPPSVAQSLQQYQNTRSAGFQGFDADGEGIYISTRFGETAQIHAVEKPMAMREQLTFAKEPTSGASPSPTVPGQFVFARDKGGDENYQIYLFDRSTGQSTMLSDGEGRKTGGTWSKDGQRVAWTKTMDGPTKGIVIADIDNPEGRETVFTGDGWWGASDFSEDGDSLILFEYVSINDSKIHLLDLESGEVSQINPSDEPISYGGAQFAANGGHLYFTSDEGSEFRNLFRYDPETGEKENLTAGIDADVGGFAQSEDGRYYAFVVNDEGRSKIHVRQSRNDRDVRVPDIPAGVIGGLEFSPTENVLGFSLNAATSPTDAYSFKVGSRGELNRWTKSEVGGLDTSAFVEPEFFRYESFDGMEIPAFIYKPKGEGPFPVIVSIHGGPEGQSRPTFSPTYQYWVNELGAAVVVPNVRGSTGFGKSYVKMDNGMKRKDSVKDIGALLDWISQQEDLNEDKVVVYGGSYGGYMVLASMVDYNDRLAGGVDIVGISSFITFLENTADYRRDLRRAEYGDERDPEMRAFFEEIDPLNNADKITKPLFIIQGLNDPRVPASEADQILAAVRANGGEAWYMGAKDEGHGFRKKTNRDAMTEAVVMFFKHVFEE